MKFVLSCFLLLPLITGALCFYFQNQPARVIVMGRIMGTLFWVGSGYFFLETAFSQQALIFEVLSILPNRLKFMLDLDRLSGFMLLLSGTLFYFIQSYSLVYLRSDETLPRFIAQLNFLFFSILVLMLSGNLFTAFCGWQFIGLSLYLLLNHYHYDSKANRAAKKKFIINRIGDMGFLLALILTLLIFQTDEFSTLFSLSDHHIHFLSWEVSARSLIGLGLLLPVITKSAQFPFHIWLPDTLETPTPVSALMHAGVINAGGFLLARLSPWWEGLHQFFYLLFFLGCATVILAGFLWQTQSDVKKQLAYSTMGQMGYMIMQCGLGLFKVAIFHLMAHGLWKAYLFLSSGNAIANAKKQTRAPKRFLSFSEVLMRLLFASSLVLLSAFFFSAFFPNQTFPPLIWYCIWMTFFWSTKYLASLNVGMGSIFLAYVKMGLIWVAYLLIYIGLDSYFNSVHNLQNSISVSIQYAVMGVLTLIQCALFLIQNEKCYGCGFFKKMYLWSLYKYKLEQGWRTILLNPFRTLGDVCNRALNLGGAKTEWARYLILFFLVLMYGFSFYSFQALEWHLWVSIIFLLFFLFVANRSPNLKTLSLDFLMITLSMANVAISLKAVSLSAFHLGNVGLLCLALFLLLAEKNQMDAKTAVVHNRLTPAAFYVACIFFLSLGIPGTATFISEYLIFSQLFLIHPYVVVVLSFAMVSLAVVVLHTLQLYIFNPSARQYLSKKISIKLHCVCLSVILINLISGCVPAWVGL